MGKSSPAVFWLFGGGGSMLYAGQSWFLARDLMNENFCCVWWTHVKAGCEQPDETLRGLWVWLPWDERGVYSLLHRTENLFPSWARICEVVYFPNWPQIQFSWHPSSMDSCIFGSWWQAACHLCFWCHVQGNALCHRAWKDTVGRGKLPGTEAEILQQGEGSQSGHRTVVSLSLLPLSQSRLGGLDGAHIWLTALWGHLKVLLQVFYWRSDAGLDQWPSCLWVSAVGGASQNLKPCFCCLFTWLKQCNSHGTNSHCVI